MNWDIVLGLTIGLFVGAFLGIFVSGLCVAASRDVPLKDVELRVVKDDD